MTQGYGARQSTRPEDRPVPAMGGLGFGLSYPKGKEPKQGNEDKKVESKKKTG